MARSKHDPASRAKVARRPCAYSEMMASILTCSVRTVATVERDRLAAIYGPATIKRQYKITPAVAEKIRELQEWVVIRVLAHIPASSDN